MIPPEDKISKSKQKNLQLTLGMSYFENLLQILGFGSEGIDLWEIM